MIKLEIIIKNNKIYTDHSIKDICLNDVALILYEFEKIKEELLKKKFKLDLRIDSNGK